MDINKAVDELRQERERIEEAIMSLERLATGRRRGPGRPQAWMVGITAKGRRRLARSKSKPSVKAPSMTAVA